MQNLIDKKIFEDLNKIPNKLYFRIGEVAKILNLKRHVLRYWELEFDSLRPKKHNNSQRFYTRKELELLFCIKRLLYDKGFSIKGAKSYLTQYKKDVFSLYKLQKKLVSLQSNIQKTKLDVQNDRFITS